ncbi:cupin domain-containing protein [Sphingobacterium sp. 40-24]|uniref:(R)-mandelonitrile lyase n=1 Tax=Sphingobacterium sp. 40-24 TaxID=1895843 RepID=UPI000A6A60F0|nr:cupin domain-containing protein [Sphingobacterium sp. 40-24]
MNIKNTAILFLSVMLGISCNQQSQTEQAMQEKTQEPIFAKGEKVTNDNFTGTVWVNYLSETDTIHNVNIGSVTFEPGARTNWHYHKGGQILLVTEGKGLYQEKGKPVEVINRGDVMKCPPDIEHWHGATSDEAMTHIAIGTNTNVGGAVWLQPVTDEEYNSNKK